MKKAAPAFALGVFMGIVVIGCMTGVTPQGGDFRFATNGTITLDTLDGTAYNYADRFLYNFSDFATTPGDDYVGRYALIDNSDDDLAIFDTFSGTLIRIKEGQAAYVREFPAH
ncbi:MAG: hypothetical protein HYV26_15115 [Candidatus Hydrogenedentes bacterium]|nr:hypothetical protein [Candidatus Hydrogenedentota bacterium]